MNVSPGACLSVRIGENVVHVPIASLVDEKVSEQELRQRVEDRLAKLKVKPNPKKNPVFITEADAF